MSLKRWAALFVFLLFWVPVFAGPLVTAEAVKYFNEGVQAQKEGNFTKATMCYDKVLIMAPERKDLDKYITNNMGIILAQSGDLEKAESCFRQVLKKDPAYTPAKLNLGLIYDKNKKRLDSLEYWSTVFNLDNLKPKGFILEQGKNDK